VEMTGYGTLSGLIPYTVRWPEMVWICLSDFLDCKSVLSCLICQNGRDFSKARSICVSGQENERGNETYSVRDRTTIDGVAADRRRESFVFKRG